MGVGPMKTEGETMRKSLGWVEPQDNLTLFWAADLPTEWFDPVYQDVDFELSFFSVLSTWYLAAS